MPLSLRLGSRRLHAAWYWLLLVMAGAALFYSLGLWQWHRAGEKRALQQAFNQGATGVQWLGQNSSATLPRYARVRVSGRYDTQHQFLLDNVIRNGRAGYEVLTPLRLADQRTLLVNRGWLPLVGGARSVLPDIALQASDVTIEGLLDELPVSGLREGRAAPSTDANWPKLTSFPTAAELGTALGTPLEPRQLLLSANAADGYRRDWQPASIGFGPERHIAYAVQWWSLGVLAVVLFFALNLKRIHP